jgi:hypothetical protein
MVVAAPRVPNPGVPINDLQTGLVNKDWYTYLASLHLAVVAKDGSTALRDFATDAAAAAGGVPLHGLYRTGNVVKIRVT